MSQIRIVLSSPLEASLLLSGVKAIAWTGPAWLRKENRSFLVATSHRVIASSGPAEARVLPSGEKAMDWIASETLSSSSGAGTVLRFTSSCLITLPEVRSQRHIFRSVLPEASRLPLGETTRVGGCGSTRDAKGAKGLTNKPNNRSGGFFGIGSRCRCVPVLTSHT